MLHQRTSQFFFSIICVEFDTNLLLFQVGSVLLKTQSRIVKTVINMTLFWAKMLLNCFCTIKKVSYFIVSLVWKNCYICINDIFITHHNFLTLIAVNKHAPFAPISQYRVRLLSCHDKYYTSSWKENRFWQFLDLPGSLDQNSAVQS